MFLIKITVQFALAIIQKKLLCLSQGNAALRFPKESLIHWAMYSLLCPCRRTVKESLIHAKIFPLTVEWVRTYLLLRGRSRRGLPVAAPGGGPRSGGRGVRHVVGIPPTVSVSRHAQITQQRMQGITTQLVIPFLHFLRRSPLTNLLAPCIIYLVLATQGMGRCPSG